MASKQKSRPDFGKNTVVEMSFRIIGLALPWTFAGFSCACGYCIESEANNTNVVLCMADDLGWGSVGYNGSEFIKTPNLDRLASEGVQFDNFYSAAPVCSPTRASCLNGRNPYRTGVFKANCGILRPEEVTIAEILKEHSYTCGHFGKWHLGTFTTSAHDANRGGPGHPELFNPPSLHGFDFFFSTESKVPTWDPMRIPSFFEEDESRKFGWRAIEGDEKFSEYGTSYWSPKGRVSENLKGDDSRIIMDRVIPFIENAVKRKKPFLAVIWFHAPHLPVVAGPKYAEMYKKLSFQKQQYGGAVTAMDDQIGRLVLKLKDLKLYKDTLFFFASDNGPERNTPGETGGRKGLKRSLYDGGVHVPAIMVWPARFPKHEVVKTPCVTSDYLPTILDALNIPLKKNDALRLDGVSMLPFIKDNGAKRSVSIPFVFKNQLAVNDGQRFKFYKKSNGNPELYDLLSDPAEKNNLADKYPEKVSKLSNYFFSWFKDVENSFNCLEYGDASFEKLKQKWPGLRKKKHKNKRKRKRE